MELNPLPGTEDIPDIFSTKILSPILNGDVTNPSIGVNNSQVTVPFSYETVLILIYLILLIFYSSCLSSFNTFVFSSISILYIVDTY